MIHRFDPMRILMQYASHKGLPFWGLKDKSKLAEGADFDLSGRGYSNEAKGADFDLTGRGYSAQSITMYDEHTKKYTRLRYKDAMGRWVFMPVVIETGNGSGYSYELPYAIMSISGKKTIVETPLVGRVGSVKELISIDDYNISITAVLVGENGSYPEAEIEMLDNIWRINEPVDIISAFTDILLGGNDKIVIKSIKYPSMQGVEDAQIVTIECVTDRPFELYV